jgi:uncharacterized protein YqeY
MSLKERLDTAMKDAMRARDDLRLSTIRLVRSAIRNKEIDQKKSLEDSEISEVFSTLAKQRRESIRMFGDAGRIDLVEKEKRELGILLEFLPRQLSRDEIVEIVGKVISETGAQGGKDMGMVMKAVKSHLSGTADGKAVSEIVRGLLG